MVMVVMLVPESCDAILLDILHYSSENYQNVTRFIALNIASVYILILHLHIHDVHTSSCMLNVYRTNFTSYCAAISFHFHFHLILVLGKIVEAIL